MIIGTFENVRMIDYPTAFESQRAVACMMIPETSHYHTLCNQHASPALPTYTVRNFPRAKYHVLGHIGHWVALIKDSPVIL